MWLPCDTDLFESVTDVSVGPTGICIAVGTSLLDGNPLVQTSTDGIHWTSIASLANHFVTIHACVSGANGLLIVGGQAIADKSPIVYTSNVDESWKSSSSSLNLLRTSAVLSFSFDGLRY